MELVNLLRVSIEYNNEYNLPQVHLYLFGNDFKLKDNVQNLHCISINEIKSYLLSTHT